MHSINTSILNNQIHCGQKLELKSLFHAYDTLVSEVHALNITQSYFNEYTSPISEVHALKNKWTIFKRFF